MEEEGPVFRLGSPLAGVWEQLSVLVVARKRQSREVLRYFFRS